MLKVEPVAIFLDLLEPRNLQVGENSTPLSWEVKQALLGKVLLSSSIISIRYLILFFKTCLRIEKIIYIDAACRPSWRGEDVSIEYLWFY